MHEKNPLLDLLDHVTPNNIKNLHEEILKTETHLEKLKALYALVQPSTRTDKPKVKETVDPAPVLRKDGKPRAKMGRKTKEEIRNPKVQLLDANEALEARKEVAEFLFKKGLALAVDVATHCSFELPHVNALLEHHWFEQFQPHKDSPYKWRLTHTGKNEAIDM